MLKTLSLSILLATIAATLIIAPSLSHIADAQQSKKPDNPKKPKNCNVKVQVKVTNVPQNQLIIAELYGLQQQKMAEVGETDVSFMFQFKKAGTNPCPVKGDVMNGQINGNIPFPVTIKDVKKPTKVTVNLP